MSTTHPSSLNLIPLCVASCFWRLTLSHKTRVSTCPCSPKMKILWRVAGYSDTNLPRVRVSATSI
jgi:hypothetical protein